MRRTTLLAPMVLAAMLAALPAFAQAPPPPPPPPLTPLQPPPQPAGNRPNPSKVLLGKALFWDEQLSATRTVACGSCHQAKAGGFDPRSRAGAAGATNPGLDGVFGTTDDVLGSPGVVLNHTDHSLHTSSLFGMHAQVTPRASMSFANSAYAPEVFWDGRAGATFLDPETGDTLIAAGGALENQSLGPPLSSVEMGSASRVWADLEARLGQVRPLALAQSLPTALNNFVAGRTYDDLFSEAFGSPGVTAARIAMAIAAYERTQWSNQSPFDSLIAGTAALTPQEQAGFNLFGALGCAGCHGGSLMSDNRFHYTGVRPAAEDSGRMIVTHDLADLGAMKTPSLRNVALRGAFMHDGRFTTLQQVVDFYDRGGDFTAPNLAPGIRPLGLTLQQKANLVAFMSRPLTDPRVAAETAPFDRPGLYSESALVPQVLAGGVPGGNGQAPLPVALEPPLAGNPDFTVGVWGALGGAQAVLVIDASEPPASGGIPASGSLAYVSTLLAGAGDGNGYGSATVPIADDPALYGKTFYGRWYVVDPNAQDGVASSPSFKFTVFGAHGDVGTLAVSTPSAPRALRLYAGSPNPFPSTTTLRFDLFAASDVKLDVYDVTGRAVRRLYARSAAMPGPYAVQWDGRDDGGRDLPGGMYFYRLVTDHGSETARVVRLQ